ncbi:hypothetical protein CEXT_255011 [Caerostris extrusa]|uniref:Uncharacterized protein n=1 Tax=Caerostris extrusa TaxID=172846 RepID=A0AAV4RXC4_CAEEX|nr:hypothetical protein CEXT_255011 [Caerostris extrusa]
MARQRFHLLSCHPIHYGKNCGFALAHSPVFVHQAHFDQRLLFGAFIHEFSSHYLSLRLSLRNGSSPTPTFFKVFNSAKFFAIAWSTYCINSGVYPLGVFVLAPEQPLTGSVILHFYSLDVFPTQTLCLLEFRPPFKRGCRGGRSFPSELEKEFPALITQKDHDESGSPLFFLPLKWGCLIGFLEPSSSNPLCVNPK